MMKDENVVAIYLDEINRIPLLTREEETQLAKLAKNGDKRAKDKIVCANLRFVVNVAKKYQNQGLDLPDLINEGNIGLMNAIERFDVNKGYHFISYAVWWIRQAILKAICEKSRAIRLPTNRVNEIVKIEHARASITGNKTEEQEFIEIAKMLDMDESHVREMAIISREMLSLDANLEAGQNDNAHLGDFIQDTKHESPEEAMIADALKNDIDEVLATLRPSEARIIRMRYGLNGGKPMSLKEIGEECHLTKERIRQIEKHAIKRMQHPLRMRRLEAYRAA